MGSTLVSDAWKLKKVNFLIQQMPFPTTKLPEIL